MSDLKQKTIYGLIWNFFERFFNYIIQFVVGIILARYYLSPNEFGLMGMLAIFISLSQVLIDSGLTSAIIRKKEATTNDYASVFVFNVLVSTVFFLLLLILATPISRFYDEPVLRNILIVLALGLIVEAFGSIQAAKLQKEMNFKRLTQVSFFASLISGLVAIVLAQQGYGIWALVALHMIRVLLNTIFLWIFTAWSPLWKFDKHSFKELYAFGSKLLLSGLVDTIYNKGFYLLIGKFYSATSLGYFNRGERFQSLVSENITGWMSKVSYPLLSQIKDKNLLKETYKKIIKNLMFISFILLLGLGAVSESLILTLLGEKWRDSIPYLQLLVFSGIWLPIQAVNTDVLKVFGRSDLFLKVVLIKKSIAIPVMIITALISIKVMIFGMIFMAILSYIINVYWSNKFVNYPLKEQLADIMPSFFLALVNAALVYTVGRFLDMPHGLTLLIQLVVGALFIVGYCELTHHEIYDTMKKTIFDLIKKKTRN